MVFAIASISVMRLIIVANRLPFTVSLKEGRPQFETGVGGLTTGLRSYLEKPAANSGGHPERLWFGWPGATIPVEDQAVVREHGKQQFGAWPIFLPEESMDRFYHGFCNKTIWPLFHYFPMVARYEEEYWQKYKQVNQIFCDELIKELRPDDVVWVHDYQLMLLPKMLRERLPNLAIGFFLHIPFPSFELFRLLPASWRTEIVEGLLGASLVGFHTHDYTRHFLSCVLRTVGYEHQLGTVMFRERAVKVDTFPMGIDFERFAQAAAAPQTDARVAKLRTRCRGLKVIFSVDRLDYTKGLINRLRGYELFLRTHPEWWGKVVFVMSVAPSRTNVDSYQSMKKELEQMVGRIVGAYGNVQWSPLIYQYCSLSFEEIVALYRLSDVALITPLRDGMNLVAKEFIASRPDRSGVLILSEMAGAAREMGEALIINPFHKEEFATALQQALTMPLEEQVRRNQLLQERLSRYDVDRWGEDFLMALQSTQVVQEVHHARSLMGKVRSALVREFASAGCRALLLDYDGTLVPFVDNPWLARPDPELLSLIERLCAEEANEIAIVSGRPRADLQAWFGHLPVALIAEHGIWLRRRDEEWRALITTTAEWKERVRPMLQVYVDRLPGALLEEKEFSLAWHYRRADPAQASIRAAELLDDIADFTRNIDVQVLEGDKVLEVRTTSVTKGTAALEWLGLIKADFVLGVGDDWTDEDLFQVLPRTAYSVKVGLAPTNARYHLGSHGAVRRLLRELNENTRCNDSGTLAALGRKRAPGALLKAEGIHQQ
jgi:trehalose 6-phosphate synthase/phosphatase